MRKTDGSANNFAPQSLLALCASIGRKNKSMRSFRVVAIPTEVASAVRETMRAPVYGFPALAEVANDPAPCRHCLRIFAVGTDRRILFTYDRFAGVETLPQPGPVYVHAEDCTHYPENAGFPEELRAVRARWKPMLGADVLSRRSMWRMESLSRS